MSSQNDFAFAAPTEWIDCGLIESDEEFAALEPARGLNAERSGATLVSESRRLFAGATGHLAAIALGVVLVSAAGSGGANFAAATSETKLEHCRAPMLALVDIRDQPLTRAQWDSLSSELRDPPAFNDRVLALLGARI